MRNTGGSAFPRAGKEWGDKAWTEAMAEEGMTMRDYFAAKAMPMIAAMPEFVLRYDPEQVADRAYEWADAMLKARDA
jgi:hypothetical protein